MNETAASSIAVSLSAIGSEKFLGGAISTLQLGGPVMAVLLALSVVGLAIVLLKLYQFARLRIMARDFIAGALGHWSAGRPHQALRALAETPNPIALVLETAIQGLDRVKAGDGDDKVREEVTRVATTQLKSLGSHLRGLEVIASLAPLLGLLGTVLGMITAFQTLQEAGGGADPALLAGGIWEALLTTAAGLTIAIPVAIALNLLESAVDRVRHAMEDAVTRVFTSEVVGRRTAVPATD